MKLMEIKEEEYLKYALNNDKISIYQYPEWGKLKETNGWNYYLLALKDNEKIMGETLLLRKKIFNNMYLFYSPRGFLIDSKDFNLLKEFSSQVIDFVKKHQGFMLKIDPNVIYKVMDKDGNNSQIIGQKDFDNYINLGFKHFGFNLNFETLQPRFLCRYKIQDTYENTIKTFSKTTQKNTDKCLQMGVETRKLNISEMNLFMQELHKTADNKHFVLRPSIYYENMLKLFKDDVVYYLTYLDTSKYYNYLLLAIKNEKINYQELLDKKQKYANTGNKLDNEINISNNKINKLTKELEEASILKSKANVIPIGALMSVFTGDEGITFMSGTDSEYKQFFIKYAFYNEHLKESIKRGKKYVNFYGISGDLNPQSEYYNIYEIKKGYNPEITELLGEFDYIINRYKYNFYKILLKLYETYKHLKRN